MQAKRPRRLSACAFQRTGVRLVLGRRFVWPLAKRDRERWCALLRKLANLKRVRNERSLAVEELARKSGVPRATIAGLEEGTRRARQTTTDKLAGALGVEPGELSNEGGVTILEEKLGDRVRVVKRYDNYTLEMSYDESRLGDAYRVILESWDGWEEFRRLMPRLEDEYGREWVVEVLGRIVRARLTGEEFVLPETLGGD